MKNFIAIDFETANRNRHSICAVGMVFVEKNKIVDTVYSLIDPEEPFDGMNTYIHGIRLSDTEGAPTFNTFYESIQDRLKDQIMIAHNLSFDGYALRDNLNRYNIMPVQSKLLCSYQLSKRLIPGKPSYSLKSICDHFDIDIINHHHALSDAQACAEIMIKLSNEFGLHDLEAIFSKTNIKAGEISPGHYRSSLVSSTKKRKLDVS
ncbi:3'-5' exonuclease [Heyndrickxia sp. NPDC080065]|uniref:3'-5' exonuclease n=1 Tax=Heyndrickxia sp. NPDC080065 TaxID=3390568 RepID=UPI003D02662C